MKVNERTLRRAWALGMVHGTRVTPYRLELPPTERAYLRGHWRILSCLRGALRTEPGVAMAVLFGSVARGDDDAASDVDVLVALRDPGIQSQVALAERLCARTGLALELVALEDAMRRPSLMLEILRDGRVLVDREGRWPELCAHGERIRAQAQLDRKLRAARAHEAAAAFARRAASSS